MGWPCCLAGGEVKASQRGRLHNIVAISKLKLSECFVCAHNAEEWHVILHMPLLSFRQGVSKLIYEHLPGADTSMIFTAILCLAQSALVVGLTVPLMLLPCFC